LTKQEALIPALSTDHANWIDIKQKGNSATLQINLGIENVGLAEAQVKRLKSLWVFVEQKPEIGCRFMGSFDGQQHG
jgi:hypothetical protein